MSWGLAIMACTPGTLISTGEWGVWFLRRWGILSYFLFAFHVQLIIYRLLSYFACVTGNLLRFMNLGTFQWFLYISAIWALLVWLWMLRLLEGACSSKISKIDWNLSKISYFHTIPCVSVPWMFQPFKPFARLAEMLSKLLVSVNQ